VLFQPLDRQVGHLRRRPDAIVTARDQEDRAVDALDRNRRSKNGVPGIAQSLLERLAPRGRCVWQSQQGHEREPDAAKTPGGSSLAVLGIGAGPHDVAGHVGDDQPNFRIPGGNDQRRFSAPRMSQKTDTFGIDGRMRAQPVNRTLEVLERNLDQIAGQAGHAEVRERQHGVALRRKRLAVHRGAGDAAIRA